MAKGSGKKKTAKSKGAVSGRDRRAERLEKALAAALRREAKVASRLEAAQLEVAVLRMALAEVVGEVFVEAAPVAVADVEAEPTPQGAPAAKAARAPKAPRAAKPAATKTAAAAKAPAPKAPRAAKAPRPAKPTPPTRPGRTTRIPPADR